MSYFRLILKFNEKCSYIYFIKSTHPIIPSLFISSLFTPFLIFGRMSKFSLLVICLVAACTIARGNAPDTRSDSIHILHTYLAIDVSDFSAKVLHGRADLTFSARVSNVNYIKLDLLGLSVDSVRAGAAPLRFSYNDSTIAISLPSPLKIGENRTISVYYHGKPVQMPGDFGGFYWDDLYAFNIGVSFLAEPHNYGKVWFPCFDNFVERSTFHFAVTTDASRRAICNGHQDSVTVGAKGNKTWHWTMNDPIPSYLVAMSVSDYAVLEDSYRGLNGTIPILLAARAQDTAHLKISFQHLKDALRIFENRFGPYPFERVGYCLVPFTAGAMEHATNISYMLGLVNGNTSNENVMAHELSHHWFGDMVTCDNESEMWLNEGWGRYCEEIFYEGLYGEDRYRQRVRTNHEIVIRLAHVRDGAYRPLTGMPSEYTYSSYSVYDKGADRLHTLRSYMGDSLFFGCFRGFLQQYKFKDINSYKLRDYLVSCSGLKNINDFFTDWIFDGGFPDFSIEHQQIKKTGTNYTVSFSIRQHLDHASHYFTHVPLEVAFFDSVGHKTIRIANVSADSTQYTASLSLAPAYIALNFDEKLSDAVTSQWYKMIGTDQHYDFTVAKMSVEMVKSSDTSLVRVEHHWVAPDAGMNHIHGLRLSDYRYWMVDGVWSADFQASAVFYYNGSTNGQGYMDNTLIRKDKDKLVLVYRPDAESDWQISDAVLHRVGDAADRIGSLRINKLKKGQYALAVYDAH